jgi:TonB family protein
MLHPLRLLLPFCALWWSHGTMSAAAGTEPPKTKDAIVRPKASVLGVEYPGFPDREALVSVRFRVRANGRVSDVEVLDTGFHEKRFVDEALRAIKTARFRPAMKNGVPMDDYLAVQRFVFALGGQEKGVTADFRKELDKVGELIRSGDNAGAHFHAEWMLSQKAKLLYEYAALQAQLAFTHARVGTVHRALAAAIAGTQQKSPTPRDFDLEELSPPNKASYYMLPEQTVTDLLEMRFRLAALKGMLLESIKAYQELAGLVKIPDQDPRALTAASIVAALKGDKPLVAHLRVEEKGFLTHKLFRQTFSIVPLAGMPSKVRLQCAGQNLLLDFKPDVEWTRPASWEDCQVLIEAPPGTELDFAEYKPSETQVVLPRR